MLLSKTSKVLNGVNNRRDDNINIFQKFSFIKILLLTNYETSAALLYGLDSSILDLFKLYDDNFILSVDIRH